MDELCAHLRPTGLTVPMFKIVLVKGCSMTPTLQNGERVLAWTPFSRRQFKRGSIVTLHRFFDVHVHLTDEQRAQPGFQKALAALEREPQELLIKRLVGLPGDTVRVPAGQLSPGKLPTIDPQAMRCGDEFVWHVPKGQVFVRGDGVQSGDSVSWGPIPITHLEQIVLCRFPSFERIP
jgi:signal peptidase I